MLASSRTYFDGRDSKTCRTKQDSNAARGDSFPKSTDHTAGHKDVLHVIPHEFALFAAKQKNALCDTWKLCRRRRLWEEFWREGIDRKDGRSILSERS